MRKEDHKAHTHHTLTHTHTHTHMVNTLRHGSPSTSPPLASSPQKPLNRSPSLREPGSSYNFNKHAHQFGSIFECLKVKYVALIRNTVTHRWRSSTYMYMYCCSAQLDIQYCRKVPGKACHRRGASPRLSYFMCKSSRLAVYAMCIQAYY